MNSKIFLLAIKNIIDSYLKHDSDVIVLDTISGDKLDDFDFIDLLIRMLNNFKEENYEKRNSYRT